MHIRSLTVADAEAYWGLRLRALRDHQDAFGTAYEEVRDRPLATTREMLSAQALSPNDRILGAFDTADRLVGMARLSRAPALKERHKAELIGMYVAPEVRGQGIAQRLVEVLIQQARSFDGVEQILLAVTTTNVAARALYLCSGFVVYGTEPHALRLPDGTYLDEDLMILRLGTAKNGS